MNIKRTEGKRLLLNYLAKPPYEIRMDQSTINKLIKVYTYLKDYPRFRFIKVELEDLAKHSERIHDYLSDENHKDMKTYWSSTVPLCNCKEIAIYEVEKVGIYCDECIKKNIDENSYKVLKDKGIIKIQNGANIKKLK